ncbi:MAG: hypothetical protein OXI08_01975, partial [Cyanobacteria bacterium MAG IRC4_bin_6]|nr:hypothetical protein [Cyanobacteria bacterium MAG IRC4_bin_6]
QHPLLRLAAVRSALTQGAYLPLCRCAIDQASSENSKVQTPYRPTAETVVEVFVGSMHGRGIHESAAHRGARG